MSKGLGKLQRAIVGLLDGSIPRKVYSPGALVTNELLEELERLGLLREGTSRKVAMHTVRRACMSLSDRGIIRGEYIIHDPCYWADVLSWSIAKAKEGGEGEAGATDCDRTA